MGLVCVGVLRPSQQRGHVEPLTVGRAHLQTENFGMNILTFFPTVERLLTFLYLAYV